MQGHFHAGLQVAVSTLLTWVSCTQVAVGGQQVAVRPRLALLPGGQAVCTALAGWLGFTDGPHLQAYRHTHDTTQGLSEQGEYSILYTRTYSAALQVKGNRAHKVSRCGCCGWWLLLRLAAIQSTDSCLSVRAAAHQRRMLVTNLCVEC